MEKTELQEAGRQLHKEGTGRLSAPKLIWGVGCPIYSLQIGQWEQLESFNIKSVFKFFCGV